MKANFKTNFKLLTAWVGVLYALPAMAGVTARPCPSNQRAKCDYGQSQHPNRAFYVDPDEAWKREVEEFFKDKVDNLPIVEQIIELKKEIKKLRKQLHEISKKANVKMD